MCLAIGFGLLVWFTASVIQFRLSLLQIKGLSVIINLKTIFQTLPGLPVMPSYGAPFGSVLNLLRVIYDRVPLSLPCICIGGGVVAEWFRALARTGDQTVPAGSESHSGKLFASELWQFRLPSLASVFRRRH